MNKKIFIAFTFLFLFSWSWSQQPKAQSKEELEKKKEKLLKEINSLQSDLDKTKKNKNATIAQVNNIKKKIQAREELINTYSTQVGLLSKNINETGHDISVLGNELKRMQDNYAAMVRYTYEHHSSYDVLLFIFSAESFNDAIRRIKYTRSYNTYKQLQAGQIQATVGSLTDKKTSLQNEKQEKKHLLTEQESQKAKLDREKAEQLVVAKNLAATEKNLKANLEKKKKEQAKLNKQIEDIIRREILAANKAASKTTSSSTSTTKTNTNSSYVLALTPEAKELSNNFAANMGKFPWPVEKGEVTEGFGTHAHPQLENITTKNNGVDIKTNAGASVRCIFKGNVVGVLTNPVYHRAVLVRHGEYFTVYSNLETVNVKAGDVVSLKEVIGKAYTDSETGVTMVHLEVWKGTTFMDPAKWLMRR